MSKTPSAVVSFENVPADAADPVIDVYVNGIKKSAGGGGGGADIALFHLTKDNTFYNADCTLQDILDAISAMKFIVFTLMDHSGENQYEYYQYFLTGYETGETTYVYIKDCQGNGLSASTATTTENLVFETM